MIALERFILGLLAVIILGGLWLVALAVGASFGPPEWLVR